MNKFIISSLIIYLLILINFINAQLQSNARINEISFNNDQYGDPLCYFTVNVLVDNIESGYMFSDLTGSVTYNDPMFTYETLVTNATDASFIYQIDFRTATIPNDSSGVLTLQLLLKNKQKTTSTVEKTLIYYCEQPPTQVTPQTSRFIMSADRLKLVGKFRILEMVRSNLPMITGQIPNGKAINSLEIKPYANLNYYTVSISVLDSFSLSDSLTFSVFYLNWAGEISITILCPLFGITSGTLISTLASFSPSTSSAFSLHTDNTIYGVSTFTSDLPIEYVFSTSSSSRVATMYSTMVSGSTQSGIITSVWYNPFFNYNYNQHIIQIMLWQNDQNVNKGTSYDYSISQGYIQRQGTFITPVSAIVPDNDKIILVTLNSNDLSTESMSVPITYNILHTGYDAIQYNHKSKISFPYGVSNPIPTSPLASYFKKTVLMSSFVPTGRFKVDLFTFSNPTASNPQNNVDISPPIVKSFKITAIGDNHFLIEASVSENGGSGFLEIVLSNSYDDTLVSLKNVTLLSCLDFKSGDVYNDSEYKRIYRPSIDSIGVSHKFYVVDQVGNSIEMNQYYNFQDQPIIKIPSSYYEPSDKWELTKFSFVTPTVNLENPDGVWNTAYLNFSNINPSKITLLNYPYFMLTPYKLNPNVHFYKAIPFFWNSTKEMFQVNFYLPSNIPSGTIDYKITNPFNGTEYYSSFINSYLNLDTSTILTASTNNFIAKPPVVSKLDVESNLINVLDTDVSNQIGKFYISFEDPDLSIGLITVATYSSNFVKRYLNLTILSGEALIGYQPANTWQINFTVTCISTKYEIVYAKFINSRGYISEFSKYDSLYTPLSSNVESPPLNPFFKLYSSNQLATIETTCQSSNDGSINSITLSSLNIKLPSDSILDVSSPTLRTLNINFTVTDTVYGIDLTQPPIIYLIGGLYGKNMLSFPATSTNEGNINVVTFSTQVQVPLNFAYPNPIFIEIYGVSNKRGMIIGWSSSEIQSLSSQNKNLYSSSIIQTTSVPNLAPIISSASELYNDNNVLTIYGFNLLNDCMVRKRFNTSSNLFEPMVVLTAGGNKMTIGIKDQINQNFLITIYSVDEIISNEFTIQVFLNAPLNLIFPPIIVFPPTPTPTPTISVTPTATQTVTSLPTLPPVTTNAPQKCKSDCGGVLQGHCSSFGCVCYSPWVGVDCLSKVVIIPPPDIDLNQPSFNLTVNRDNVGSGNSADVASLVGIISIVSIRELDINQIPIKTHKFPIWKLDKLSEYENYYTTDIVTSNSSGIEVKCTVSVSTIWYQSLTNVTFADQQLIMNPSTLKYNINITSYPFESNLNTLELVVSATATIEDKKISSCSDQTFGETILDNSNYVQLSVNDHSLYGRFIKRGIVDNTKVLIGNVLLKDLSNKDSYYSSQSHIGIRIPKYNTLVQLDPDFSVLVNSKSANSLCNDESNSEISKGALIGVVIGCVGGALIITAAIILAVKYKYQIRNFNSVIKMKTKR